MAPWSPTPCSLRRNAGCQTRFVAVFLPARKPCKVRAGSDDLRPGGLESRAAVSLEISAPSRHNCSIKAQGSAWRQWRFRARAGSNGLWVSILLLLAALTRTRAEEVIAGPLFSDYKLTLTPGRRMQVMGPLYYEEERESERIWAVPPLLSLATDETTGVKEFDFLYPLLTYDRYGTQHRWQFFQILNFTGGPMPEEKERDRFTLFPVYFQQRSSDPAQDYTAVFPFYGHLRHRFFHDEIFFVAFPFYARTLKHDIVTWNYFYPFVDRERGPGMRGWQVWPLAGHSHKEITTREDSFHEPQTVPGFDSRFVLWPFYLHSITGIGTPQQASNLVSFPIFSVQRSPQRDATGALWLFQHVDDREKKYREWDLPWPFIEFARGEGKTANRVIPFYDRTRLPLHEQKSIMWPFYKHNHDWPAPLDRQRTRVLFWVYSNLREKNTETGAERRRVDGWPLLLHTRDFDGNSRWQILALIEAFVPGSHKIKRDYSPLWSLWVSEKNPRTGASSQSLLWNLYRHEATPTTRRTSLLLGLFQSESGPEGKRVRLFYIPLGGKKHPVAKKFVGAPEGQTQD